MNSNSEKSLLSAESSTYFNNVEKQCIPRIDRATVSIIGIQQNEIRHDRTGVLYEVADQYFILTASHELQAIVAHEIPLYVSVNIPGVLLELSDALFHSTEEDDRDVAAIWLPSEIAKEISKYKDFLHHNQIKYSTDDSNGLYMIYGYPMGWAANLKSENSLQSKALAFAGQPYEGERLPTAKYHPDVHMTLVFSRDAIRLRDTTQDYLPDPKGISGCGIWRVGDIDLQSNSLIPRTADTVTLVGIQHRWFPSLNYLQGTKIRYLMEMILSSYPELEPAMSIVY